MKQTIMTFDHLNRVPTLSGDVLSAEAFAAYMQALSNIGLLYHWDDYPSEVCWQVGPNEVELKTLIGNHNFIWLRRPDLWDWIELDPMLVKVLSGVIHG